MTSPVVPKDHTEANAAMSALIEAGRRMATLIEEVQVQGCANAPPHPDDCPDCRDARAAIFGWAQAVVRVRGVAETLNGKGD